MAISALCLSVKLKWHKRHLAWVLYAFNQQRRVLLSRIEYNVIKMLIRYLI